MILKKRAGFSLVEILVALIVVSLIAAAMAPVITKKLSSSGITIGGGGGGGGVPTAGACGVGQYFDMDEQACKHCPEGHFCDGFNKLVCLAGTSTSADGTDKHPLNGQSQCKECADGYYAPEASPACIKNTAKNCAEFSKLENACISCSGEDILVNGNCVKDVPVYKLKNPSGTDITDTSTEFVKGSTYWTLKIKATGTLTFSSLPSNVMDVFMIGGGAAGQVNSSGCGNYASGGGSYNIISNVIVKPDTAYPITIGAGGAVQSCAQRNGETTSAFGTYAHGGVYTGSHAICPFNDATCDRKYGEVGNSSNQIANTGNGGAAASKGMSGVVILRGLVNSAYANDGTFPTFQYKNPTGSDITYSDVTLNITDEYWYMKFASSGTVTFNSLPTKFIDVFAVGGGAGGQVNSSGCGNYPSGGGSYSILKNVAIATDTTYPISIGNGGGTAACNQPNGVATTGFGTSAAGGVYSGDHTVCPFNDASCDVKYGSKGNDINQNHNTGNGGTTAKPGMSGVVIIRGKRVADASTPAVPTYKYLTTSGVDATTENSALSVSGPYWYLKFTASGNVIFNSLPNKFIDVFAVGGGAGGQVNSSGCGNYASGGGNFHTLKNVVIATEKTYPITIGGGGSTAYCNQPNGGTTGAFGAFSYGGVYSGSHSTCQFGDSTCDIKYGNKGTDTNQNPNTGNGGTAAKPGMSGIVIIRGKAKVDDTSPALPSYKFLGTSGVDTTTSHTTLSVTDDYWYLKFTESGTAIFDSLPTNFVDVFVVGGGAGGQVNSSGCGNYPSGGGTYNISKNVYIVNGASYPVAVGAGAGTAHCNQPDGGASSGFGVISRGGVYSANYTLCPFGDSDCDFTYGNKGTDTNQNPNTGNGGTAAKAGMKGTVIIRGKINRPVNADLVQKIPTYSYTDSGGSNITYSGSIPSVTDTHWYIKFTKSGTLKFSTIKNNKIDVFAVGGGAGGQVNSSGCGNYSAGGGNYTVQSNVAVAAGTNYPIVVGAGGAARACAMPAGGASSGFGVSAAGGSSTTAHTVCLFNGADCSTTYGNRGSDTNQFQNTGNGGTAAKYGMDGTVIIRGAL